MMKVSRTRKTRLVKITPAEGYYECYEGRQLIAAFKSEEPVSEDVIEQLRIDPKQFMDPQEPQVA